MSWSCEKKSLTSVMLLLCAVFAFFAVSACGDSVEADEDVATTQEESSSSVKSSSSKAKSSSSSAKSSSSSKLEYPDSFKPQDKEYPYAGIPRIVIETGNRIAIKDRETEIPAKMQIWGDSSAESEILDLTIRGRGNTSWTEMPKKSYKIEFEKKQSMLGMPKDKDWALIANFADKTLMRNFVAYNLSAKLNAYYAPKCEFAELYLNGEYLGVYLLTETIKVSKYRMNLPEDGSAYIVEADAKYQGKEQVVFSDVLMPDSSKKAFRIHYPKNATDENLKKIQSQIKKFEEQLKKVENGKDNHLEEWIDLDESIVHYWVQEFSKNPDTGIREGFFTSVYFSWVEGEKIKMGPVWDFDLAFGNYSYQPVNEVKDWFVQKYWYEYLFKDSLYTNLSYDFWKLNDKYIDEVLELIDVYKDKLGKPAKNNFKRWDVMNSNEHFWHLKAFSSYDEAVDDLKNWIIERRKWINLQLSEKN